MVRFICYEMIICYLIWVFHFTALILEEESLYSFLNILQARGSMRFGMLKIRI